MYAIVLFLIPGKPCWFCWLNLSVLQFVRVLFFFVNNLQAQKGKKGLSIENIASLSQAHLKMFTNCTSIFNEHFLHTFLEALPADGVFLVCYKCLKFKFQILEVFR